MPQAHGPNADPSRNNSLLSTLLSTFAKTLGPCASCRNTHTFSRRCDPILFGAVVVLALGMRLIDLERGSPWYDEVLTLYFLDADNFASFVQEQRAAEGTGSFAYLVIAWIATHYLPGDPVATLRGISIALGLFSLAGTYYMGLRTLGRYAAVTSSLLLALSLTHIFYSQGIRPYALLMAASTFASIAFLQAYAHPRVSSGWLGANTLLNVLVVWSHMLGPLLLLSQGLTLWIHRGRQVKQWLVWGACQLPGVAALGYFWIRTLDWNFVWRVAPDIPPQGLPEVLGYFHVLLGTRLERQTVGLANFMHTQVSLDTAILLGASIGLVLAAWLLIRYDITKDPPEGQCTWDPKFALSYLFLWLFAPALILFTLDNLWTTLFFARYVFHTSIPLVLLVAIGFSRFPTPWLRNSLAGLLVCALAYQYLAFEGPLRHDYKATFNTILHADGLDDPIIGYPFYYRRTVIYNWQRLFPPTEAPIPEILWPEDRSELLKHLREHSLSHGRSWLILHEHVCAPSELETDLRNMGLDFERFRIPGGMPPIFVYEVWKKVNAHHHG